MTTVKWCWAVVTLLAMPSAATLRAMQPVPEVAEPAPLLVPELLVSVDRAFPLMEAARSEQEAATGALVEARGGFDLKVKASAETLDGYYDNDRIKGSLEQPLAPLGLTLYGGYRLGRGIFAPYDEKALTRSAGEINAGFTLPLLRDRSIDARRAQLRVTDVGVDIAAQSVAKSRLSYFKDALKQYWNWVAAGRQLDVARSLLDLAERRDADLAAAVNLGQLAPVERTDNRRVILQRRSALVTAQRLVEGASIDLSLYYRGPDGMPLRPGATRLPRALPEPAPLTDEDETRAIEEAIRRRPEVAALRLKREQQEVEARLANNSLLPSLDLFTAASRDYGEGPASRFGNQVNAGVLFELPVQRRKASGKLAQARAKLAVVGAELRFAQDRVRAEVQDAASALRAAYATVEIVRQELAVARELEALERDRFDLGDSTQFLVNLRELNTADAAFREIKALADYQKALTDFDASSGRLLDRPSPP
ncbi:MAG: TolC family protein [Vicinamibacterales bacterium]